MAIEVFNRYEVKYVLNQSQYEALRDEVSEHMDCDAYNQNGKSYKICNLYLDTSGDDLICASIAKPVYKEKLRLRSYGKARLDDTVYLEIKKKFKGMTNKRRTPFKLAEAYKYLEDGTIPDNPKINRQVMGEIDYMQRIYHAYPKTYISYDRFAFFERANRDFRLTLDTNIQTRREDVRLESDVYGTPLLESGKWLMEAKAGAAFPLWFSKFLSANRLFSVSFSKYGTEYLRYVSSAKQNKMQGA